MTTRWPAQRHQGVPIVCFNGGLTPGPWYVDEGANGDVLVTATPADPHWLDNDVCHVYGGNDGDKQQALVDARAIAALPELLAAADAIIAGLADGGELALCEDGDGPVSVSRAAIRRLVAALPAGGGE